MAHTQFNGYNAFFVPAHDILTTLLSLVSKAETSPLASQLLTARTHPTMLPFSSQCGIVATTIDKLVSRVCNTPSQNWGYHDASLTTYGAIRQRLVAAQSLLKNADKDVVIERFKNGVVLLPTGGGGEEKETLPLHVFVSSFSMAYLYFHLVTAYNILRKEGLEIGKEDFMVRFNKTLDGQPGLWFEE